MFRISAKGRLRVACCALILLTCGAAVARDVVVNMKDGSTVRGALLELASESVTIDPEGPVSFRLITSAEAVSVYLADLNRTFAFPINLQEIPRKLLKKSTARPTYTSGFRPFALFAWGGIATSGLGGDKQYYEGFGSGATFRIEARYHFPNHDTRHARAFIGLSYQYSSLNSTEDVLAGWDYYSGNPLYVVFDPVKISHYALELGATTPILGKDSYLYFLMGLVSLQNSLTGRGELRDSHGNVTGRLAPVTTHDAQGALRFGAGGVIGLTDRFGLVIDGTIDLLYAGVEQEYYGTSHPVSNGDVPSLTVGVTYEL
jgi:hypothetical protein